MHIYLAINSDPSINVLNEQQYPNVLCSFAYGKAMDKLAYEPKRLTLDSGAFSAWNAKKAVDVVEYADWALEWQARVPHAAAINLDVIPGEVGRTSTAAEREAGMAASMRNADYLRSQGLRVVEVFHMDEPRQFLDELLQRVPEGQTIALSPRNDKSVKARQEWLHVVLRHLLQTYPPQQLPKFHGLAVTSRSLLRAFPFHSGDSSTWKTAFVYGVFVNENGSPEKIEKRLLPASLGMKDGREALMHATQISVNNLKRLERDTTTLWAKRGVTFDD